MVKFIQIGTEQKSTEKLVQLEKLRKAEKLRREEAELKLKAAESKMLLKIDYKSSIDDEKEAFRKLTK